MVSQKDMVIQYEGPQRYAEMSERQDPAGRRAAGANGILDVALLRCTINIQACSSVRQHKRLTNIWHIIPLHLFV